jgi:subtilisin family serine protease
MITIGASDSNDVKPDFSNWGPCVDLFAPGVNITAAWFDGTESYFTASGTSMASPHACGVAALILADKTRSFGQEDMRAELIKLATPGILSSVGEGSPNLLAFTNPPPSTR